MSLGHQSPSYGIAQRLLELHASGVTIEQMASLGKCSRESVRRYLAGTTPSASFLYGLCNGVDRLSADWLLLGIGTCWRDHLRRDEVHQAPLQELLVELGTRYTQG